jgi:hypothetical protein
MIPMAQVADIERSLTFYELLGFHRVNVLKNDQGVAFWAHIEAADARLMLSLGAEPVVATQQRVLFYFYSDNLLELRDHLLQRGAQVSEVSYPFYMPKGEIRVDDPDGYCLLIGQSG